MNFKVLRYLVYLLIIVICFCAPIYALTRIYLPDLIRSQIASNLPPGATLSFGEMFSNNDLSVNIKQLSFEIEKNNLDLNLYEIILKPQLSFEKPFKLLAKKVDIQIDNIKANFLNLKSEILNWSI